MPLNAWYMDDEITVDQSEPHRKSPPEYVTGSTLTNLGVLFWEGLTGENDEKLLEICRERGYNYTEIIFVCPEKLPDYSNKIKMFYEEHIHSDEEIRYCMEGSGYFDVRDADDRWIRILVTPGQMVIIPEGCYHRFTTDKNHYIKAMRLFVGAPVWTPYNRNSISESNSSRAKYVSNFLNGTSTLLSEDL